MIADKLMPYQREAAERIAIRRSMLLADQPGLGKTFTSLGALEISGALKPGSVSIILGPHITCDTAWLPTIQSFMPEVNAIDGFTGSRAARNKRIESSVVADKPNVIVTNHESLGISKTDKPHVPVLHSFDYAAILIDESHAVLPTKEDYPSLVTQFWRGLYSINAADKQILRIAISGTPDRGKLHYRFGTWRFLLPKQLDPHRMQYEHWVDGNFYTYTVAVPVYKNGKRFDVQVRKVGQLLKHDRWTRVDSALMVRRTKSEVAKQLPEKRYIDVDVPFSGELSDAYQQFHQNFLENDDGTQKNALVYALRAAQFATCAWHFVTDSTLEATVGGPSPKRDWLIHWLKERNLHDNADALPVSKVVISSQYSKVLDWLQKELGNEGIRAEILSGNTPTEKRKHIQSSFQDASSSLRVVLLSAGLGVGIDLDAADDLVFVDIPRNPDVQEQVEDRVHRVSRVHQVTIWRLRSRGTIDMVISAKNDEAFQETRHLMDGTRNVETERSIIARISG